MLPHPAAACRIRGQSAQGLNGLHGTGARAC